jgi:hypothetical protein
VLYYNLIVLLNKYLLLKGRHESLIETENWIDGEGRFKEEVEE